MKVHVIYHRADFDGLFSGAVCWHWLTKQGHEVSMQGWDFGDPVVQVDYTEKVYIVDLPIDCTVVNYPPGSGKTSLQYHRSDCTWIDHHKSSIEKFDHLSPYLKGLRLDGVAACRLAWQYFRAQTGEIQTGTTEGTTLDEYRERRVREPLALILAGEYDIWDKHDPRADQFQYGLTLNGPWTPETLAGNFFTEDGDRKAAICAEEGRTAMDWQQAYAKEVCKSRGYCVDFEGNRYWALASVHARNSSWFPNETVPEDCNGLLCYRIEGDGNVKVSLYNREGREDVDHSAIAVKHGGGGHKGACGFQLTLGQAIIEGIVK